MGFFSWITQDTKKSIANIHSERETFTVYLKDNKGNYWKEDAYQGYGVFNGKDFYQLLAEMNSDKCELSGDIEKDRNEGIRIFFGISAIKNKKTHQVFKGRGIDFFNWDRDIIHDNKSANQLLETKEWEHIYIKEENIVYPNIVENEDWEWRNEAPQDCPEQGFFYDF